MEAKRMGSFNISMEIEVARTKGSFRFWATTDDQMRHRSESCPIFD
jgi:hypothetical protein